MKKTLCLLLCLFLLLSSAVTVCAANDVPEEVLDSTQSVVRILAKFYQGSSSGSGFVIKNEPGEVLVVTNNHVVDGGPESISIWVSEEETVNAKILVTTAEKDLCILKVTDPVDMEPLKLLDGKPKQGSAIYAVGFPAVADIFSDTAAHTSESATITDGIISAIRTLTLEGTGDPITLLQINADINSGNSGGPLFNAKGQVVGINTYGITNAQGVFGAISVTDLKDYLAENDISLTSSVSDGKKNPDKANKPAVQTENDLVKEKVPAGKLILISAVVLLLAWAAPVIMKLRRTKKKNATTSLRDYMAAYPGGIPVQQAITMLLPVALRLQEMHACGMLHLQVNPDNILLSDQGVSLRAPTNRQEACFCDGFTAPEVYNRTGTGVGADVYSLAAVLMYLVTGKVPAHALQTDLMWSDLAMYEMRSPETGRMVREATQFMAPMRMDSMQTLIYHMTPYNMGLFRLPEKKAERKIPWLPAVIVTAVTLLVALTLNSVFIPMGNYRRAMKFKNAGEYENAITIFTALGNYRDSMQRAEASRMALSTQKYEKAKELIEKGEYEKACDLLEDIRDYLDADALWKKYSGYYIEEKAKSNFEGKWIWTKPEKINVYDQYYFINFADKTITFHFKSSKKTFDRVYTFQVEDENTLKATGFRDEGTVYIRFVGNNIHLEYPEGVHAPSKDPDNLYLKRK